MAAEVDQATNVGTSELLATFYIGAIKVPITQLDLTSIGREQRQAGVDALKKQIETDGFDQNYAPVVCLLHPLPADQTLDDVLAVDGVRFRVIDGNHRVAALKMIDDEKPAAAPGRVISVRVHQPMKPATERMVAAGRLSDMSASLCRHPTYLLTHWPTLLIDLLLPRVRVLAASRFFVIYLEFFVSA